MDETKQQALTEEQLQQIRERAEKATRKTIPGYSGYEGRMLTDAELEEIKTRVSRATPGPWKAFAQDDVAGASVYDRYWLLLTGNYYPNNTTPNFPDAPREHIDTDANMVFIAAARDDIPNLLQHIAALEARIENMKKEAAIDSGVEG